MSAQVINLRDDDPLLKGFYTLRDAARFLGVGSTQKLRAWFGGHPNSSAEPIIKRTFPSTGKGYEVSFLDLMEMRFIEHYRKKNYSLQALRAAAITAREELQTDHPFALFGVRFVNLRKRILLETADALGDKKLLDLLKKQYVMHKAVEQLLEEGVSFDQQTGLAHQWHPDRNIAPDVYLDPRFALGQPVVGQKAVTTKAVFLTYQAENEDKNKVADWYGISPAFVEQAVKFEASLAT